MSAIARARPRERRADRVAREVHLNVLVAANRFSDDMESMCRTEQVSHAQYVALWVLCLADDPEAGLPMGSIADGLLNRAADTTRLVDRMEREGLVERLQDPGDRRVVLVRATARGAAAFAAVSDKVRAYHREQWRALSADELDTLHELLGRVLLAGSEDVAAAER